MRNKTTRLMLTILMGVCLALVGCEGEGDEGADGDDGGSSQGPSGVACGLYTVELEYRHDTTIVIHSLWSDGSDYRDVFVSGTYIPQPGQSRPIGWTERVSQSANGVDLGTHTLRFQNVSYNPASFTLTIDGAYTCNYP